MLYVYLDSGQVIPFSRFDHVPEKGVLVNADTPAKAKLEGEYQRARFSSPHVEAPEPKLAPLPALVETPLNPPIQAKPATPSSDIHTAAQEVANILESMLDTARQGSKVVKVNREQLAEAFRLADYVATAIEEKAK